jgi:hypothetical protein
MTILDDDDKVVFDDMVESHCTYVLEPTEEVKVSKVYHDGVLTETFIWLGPDDNLILYG